MDTVQIEDDKRRGLITLAEQTDFVLIGIELLGEFNRLLQVDAVDRVTLVERSVLPNMIKHTEGEKSSHGFR